MRCTVRRENSFAQASSLFSCVETGGIRVSCFEPDAAVMSCLEKLDTSCLIHLSEEHVKFASMRSVSKEIQVACELQQVRESWKRRRQD